MNMRFKLPMKWGLEDQPWECNTYEGILEQDSAAENGVGQPWNNELWVILGDQSH